VTAFNDLRRCQFFEWQCRNLVRQRGFLPDHKEHRGTGRGKYVGVLACEELIEGQWEQSCSEMRCDGVFYEPLRVLERF